MGRERVSKDGLSIPGHRQLSQRLDGLARELGAIRDTVRERFGSATQAYVVCNRALVDLRQLRTALLFELTGEHAGKLPPEQLQAIYGGAVDGGRG
jgi:hypothetical protein